MRLTSTNLLLVHLQSISIGHVQSVWRVTRLNARPIEEKSDSGQLFALPFAESIHQFFQLCRPFDLEEDLVVSIGDFDIEVLGRWGCSRVFSVGRRLALIRHVEMEM